MKVKILLFFFISILLVFAKDISLAFSVWLQNPSLSFKQDTSIMIYNEALFLTHTGKIKEAQSLLGSLLNRDDTKNPADIYELYGDTVYALSGGTGDIFPFYARARALSGNTSRLDAKIALITAEKTQKAVVSDSGAISPPPQTNTGDTQDIQQKKQELITLQQNRSGLLRPGGNDVSDADILNDTLHLLQGGEEAKNW